MTKRSVDAGRDGFFTFEWVCRNPGCAFEGEMHRKRVKAPTLDKAKMGALQMGIPRYAKVLEEEEERLKMRIAW